MTNDGIFTGLLRHDSPHLWGLVKRYFDARYQKLFEDSYKLSWKYGATEYPSLTREAGVSYNPRQARVASLLISEGEVRNPTIICAAMFLCSTNLPSDTSIPVDSEVSSLISAVQQGAATSTEAECIQIAIDLDYLRHLHMMKYDRESSLTFVKQIKDRRISMIPESLRLLVLFRAALDRACRTLI